jgi:hypothetical protein
VAVTYLLTQMPLGDPASNVLGWMEAYLRGEDNGECPLWENTPLIPLTPQQVVYASKHPDEW